MSSVMFRANHVFENKLLRKVLEHERKRLRAGTQYPHVTWAHVILRVTNVSSALHSTRWSRLTKCVRQQKCERRAGAWADQSSTWRKQSDRRVNPRNRIQCQTASNIPTARVISHELTWREDSVPRLNSDKLCLPWHDGGGEVFQHFWRISGLQRAMRWAQAVSRQARAVCVGFVVH
jgi:hypothetical protein